jgi:transposase-like protein
MGVKRRKHTATYKRNVVLELLKGEKTRGEIASEFGIHPALGDKWRQQAVESMDQLFTDSHEKERKRDKRLIEELYKKIGKLEVESDFLKKKMGLIE